MTLEEAIKILEREFKKDNLTVLSDFGNAHRLGIEALKDLKAFRIKYPHSPLLPGETEEVK